MPERHLQLRLLLSCRERDDDRIDRVVSICPVAFLLGLVYFPADQSSRGFAVAACRKLSAALLPVLDAARPPTAVTLMATQVLSCGERAGSEDPPGEHQPLDEPRANRSGVPWGERAPTIGGLPAGGCGCVMQKSSSSLSGDEEGHQEAGDGSRLRQQGCCNGAAPSAEPARPGQDLAHPCATGAQLPRGCLFNV